MTTRRMAALAAAAASVALVSLGASVSANSSARRASGPPISPKNVNSIYKRFMMKAAQGNIAEVMTGKLALERASSAAVKRTAEMLIKEHSTANNDLKRVAARVDMRLPSRPNQMQMAMYRRLSRLSGPAFDKAFMAGQIKAHLDTVNLFQMEIRSGTNTDVHDYALRYLPPIQNHTTHIVRVAQRIGVPNIPRAARAYTGATSSAAGHGM